MQELIDCIGTHRMLHNMERVVRDLIKEEIDAAVSFIEIEERNVTWFTKYVSKTGSARTMLWLRDECNQIVKELEDISSNSEKMDVIHQLTKVHDVACAARKLRRSRGWIYYTSAQMVAKRLKHFCETLVVYTSGLKYFSTQAVIHQLQEWSIPAPIIMLILSKDAPDTHADTQQF